MALSAAMERRRKDVIKSYEKEREQLIAKHQQAAQNHGGRNAINPDVMPVLSMKDERIGTYTAPATEQPTNNISAWDTAQYSLNEPPKHDPAHESLLASISSDPMYNQYVEMGLNALQPYDLTAQENTKYLTPEATQAYYAVLGRDGAAAAKDFLDVFNAYTQAEQQRIAYDQQERERLARIAEENRKAYGLTNEEEADLLRLRDGSYFGADDPLYQQYVAMGLNAAQPTDLGALEQTEYLTPDAMQAYYAVLGRDGADAASAFLDAVKSGAHPDVAEMVADSERYRELRDRALSYGYQDESDFENRLARSFRLLPDDASGNAAEFLSENLAYGLGSSVEGALDFLAAGGANAAAQIGEWFGADTDTLREWAERVAINELADDRQGRQEYWGAGDAMAVAGDVASGIGGMLPTMALGALAAPAGMAYMGISSAGQSMSDALSQGADINRAMVYGALSGVLSAATEKIVGGVPFLGGGVLDDALRSLGGSSRMAGLFKTATDVLGEGAEEWLESAVSPYLERVHSEEQRGKSSTEIWNENEQERLYSFLVGSLTSAVLNGAASVSGRALSSGEQQQIRQEVEAAIVQNEADLSPQQTVPNADVPQAQIAQNGTGLADVLPEQSANIPDTRQTSLQSRTEAIGNEAVDFAIQQRAAELAQGDTQIGIDPISFDDGMTPEQRTNDRIQAAAEWRAAQETAPTAAVGETTRQTQSPAVEGGRTAADVVPIKVGKATVIKNPYNGEVPNNREGEITYSTPRITKETVEQAQGVIDAATDGGKASRGPVKAFFEKIFREMGGQRGVSIENVSFNGRSYVVSLGNKLVGKVVSDPNLSAEKLAVINNIDEVVGNAVFVGSGEYEGDNPAVIRYDYFETQTEIGGKPYTVTFDIEVYKGTNNYRTHKVINEIDIAPTDRTDAGPEPTVAPVEAISSTNMIAENPTVVKSTVAPPEVTAGTGEVAQLLPADADHETANNALYAIAPGVIETAGKIKQGFRAFYKGVVSGQAGLESAAAEQRRSRGDSLINEATQLARQTGGTVDAICETALVDMNGNPLDVSYNEVMQLVPREQWDAFNNYRENLHNIDRQAQGKPVNDKTADESWEIVREYEQQHPEWREVVKRQNEWWDTFARTWMVDSGLITAADYATMRQMYPNYIPTYRVDGKRGGGMIFGGSIKANPVRSAKGGTSEIIPLQEQFIAQVNKIVRQERINEIGLELLGFARRDITAAANSGIVLSDVRDAVLDKVTAEKMVDDPVETKALRELDDGSYRFTVMENGNPVALTISKDVYDAVDWLRTSGLSEGVQKITKALSSITAPVRSGITGYHPLFIISNFVRDVQSYVVNSTKGDGAQWASNYFRAMQEVFRKGERYRQLQALGGLRSGYYNSRDGYAATLPKEYTGAQKVGRAITAPLRMVRKGIETASQFIESVPRMAEYLNVIQREGDTAAGRRKAALASQDVTVNFTRNAPVGKALNSGVLYLNASIQGLDKTVRQLKSKPGQTLLSAAGTVAIPSIILALVNAGNPNYDELDDRTKDQYFIIPNLFGERDENGNAKTFFRLPRSREYGIVLGAVFDRAMQGIETGEWGEAFDGIAAEAWNNFAPPDVMQDNIVTMFTRTDLFDPESPGTTWYGGDIVPARLQDLSPEMQYDINTSSAARWMGERFGLSPKKIDNLIDSYGGYLGDLLQAATSPKNEGETVAQTVGNTLNAMFWQPMERRFTTDPRYSSGVVDDFYEQYGEMQRLAADDNNTPGLPRAIKTANEVGRSYLADISSQISGLYADEREVWADPGSLGDKQAEAYALREQINDLTRDYEVGLQAEMQRQQRILDELDSLLTQDVFYDLAENAVSAAGNITQEGVETYLDGIGTITDKERAEAWALIGAMNSASGWKPKSNPYEPGLTGWWDDVS